MRGVRARAVRRLEELQRAARRLRMPQTAAALHEPIAAARAGGPGWRARSTPPTIHAEISGDALEAQRWLDAVERVGRALR